MHTIKLYYGVRLYTNRIIGQELPEPKYTFEGINFILGNGVSTNQTLNGVDADESPTYLTATDEDNNTTEWFVMGSYKNRKNQLTLMLRRDFLDEKWDVIKGCPFICNKSSTIPDEISDAKYKKTMNLSQVKKKEVLLKDFNGSEGWFVFYMSKPHMVEKETSILTQTTVTSGDKSEVQTTTGKTETQKDMVLSEDYISGKTFVDGNLSIAFCNKSEMTHTQTANYDVFAIPVGSGRTFTKEGGQILRSTLDRLQVYRVAQLLSLNLGSVIYDIQYVPFITESVFSYRSGYAIITINGEERGFGQILDVSEGTIKIADNNDLKELRDEYNSMISNLDKRKYHERYTFRLTSPNYQSIFEFSIVKNDTFPTFKADIALKPYTPYIYVYPEFSGLYGGVFHDGRGMILSGDFSVDRTDSAWTNYKLQNKNFQASFDRDVQTMDLQTNVMLNEMNRKTISNAIGVFTNTASATAQGALFGPIGAVVGGVSSFAGGLTDAIMDEYRQEDQMMLNSDKVDSAKMQFQYQIGNIKAQPTTLTKVSAINPNYKVFPILEVYDCTEQEKKNLDNSILYNGIDINLMTTLSIFKSGFIEGTIVQFPSDLNLNDMQTGTINNELNLGIYYKEV